MAKSNNGKRPVTVVITPAVKYKKQPCVRMGKLTDVILKFIRRDKKKKRSADPPTRGYSPGRKDDTPSTPPPLSNCSFSTMETPPKDDATNKPDEG
ncbi:MAG: hypothetical protein LBR53_13065 [Deltaproteobacteria bacterium]|jgi:hypothetical protein|nr:hypothetical protein [Deltaproteobacteria bacterium]